MVYRLPGLYVPFPSPHIGPFQNVGEQAPFLRQGVFGLFALGDVDEGHGCSGHLAIDDLGMGPVFRGETAAIFFPQDFIVPVYTRALAESPIDVAHVHRHPASVRIRMVNELMHVPAEELFGLGVP